MNKRIEKLKKSLHSKETVLCIEKAELTTESYEQTDLEPAVLRRAKAFANVLNNVSIFIEEAELIVGNTTSKPNGIEVFGTFPPELIGRLRQAGWSISEEVEKKLDKINRYWAGRIIWDKLLTKNLDNEELWTYGASGITFPANRNKEVGKVPMMGCGWDLGRYTGCIPEYDRVLTQGLNKFIEEAELELKTTKVNSADTYEKIDFLKAVIISLKGIIEFSHRFSNLATEMASREKNLARKKELEAIAQICHWVPANPARNFYEAIQSYWFIVLTVIGSGSFFGRFDQIMFPFYKQDQEKHVITEEDAIELIECLRIKIMQLHSGAGNYHHVEGPENTWDEIVIGGIKSDGQDATNDLTYLVLEATKRCPTPFPATFLRVHSGTPDAVMMKAMELLKAGVNMPGFLGDPNSIQFLLNNGVPIEIARDYAITTCVETSPPGRSRFFMASQFSMPLVLDFFLHDGVEPRTGKKFGPKVDVESYKSFSELIDAFKKYFSYWQQVGAEWRNIGAATQAEHFPDPPSSALSYNGIKEGKDVFNRKMPFENGVGLNYCFTVNVIDSLAAIKKLVYDEKKMTIKKLRAALDANWQGYEDVQKMCLEAPKFGNDDDYVDLIAKDLFSFMAITTLKLDSVFGDKIKPVTVALSRWRSSECGQYVGPTPDGRSSGSAFADSSLSPMIGMDKNGPMAIIKSAMKIDQVYFHSIPLGMNFNPSILGTEEGMKKLSDFIKTYIIGGGRSIQINVVSKDALLEAKNNPDKHQDLIVNTSAAHWAYFSKCDKELKERLISRTSYDEL